MESLKSIYDGDIICFLDTMGRQRASINIRPTSDDSKVVDELTIKIEVSPVQKMQYMHFGLAILSSLC